MKTDPLTVTEEGTKAGTDVSIGSGETIPEAEGKRRPGTFGNAPVPGVTPGGNPDNPGDDPGVAPPLPQPDVLGSQSPVLPVDES
jgi:hypothetical protein